MNDFIFRARQVVLENLLNPQFGVSSLARKLGVSRSELYRRIKASERKSASQFIREIRLERALELLKTDQYSITEIAYLVGFNSPTYFSTSFKEYYGYSPSTADSNGNSQKEVLALGDEKPGKWKIPIVIGTIIILIAVYGIFGMNGRKDIQERNSLAVLKFDYLGSDSSQSNKALVLSDEVLNSLSNIANLKVVAPSTSFQIDKGKPCKEVGRNLGVDYLVDGSFFDSEDGLRATVKLIDANSGHQVWARTFGSSSNAFNDLQRDISNGIYRELERTLPLLHPTLIKGRTHVNIGAMELYFKAVKKGTIRYEDSIKQAIQWLERAVQLDPYFAEAYGELSFLYGRWHYYGSLKREDRDKMMGTNIQKAIELNPESPEVLFAKADYDYIHGNVQKDSSAIISDFRRVLEINPENHRSSYRLHQVFRAIGKYYTAHQYLERAWQLDPENALYNNVYARDLFWKWNEREKALEIILKGASKPSPSRGSLYFKALMLADQPGGDYLSAFTVINEALIEQPYTYGFMYWGRLLALDLDLLPLARKYAHGNEVKFPDNPIYTYSPAYQINITDRRYQDALDLTRIWLEDKGLDEKVAYSNIARVYYLQGDVQKSKEVLLSHFSDLYQDIEEGELDTNSLQLPDVSLVTNYIEVLRGEGNVDKASFFADFLCSYYQRHVKRVMYGKKLFPLDCYYIQDDVEGFLDALEDTFFKTGHRLRIYSNLKSSRYAAFEDNPAYQELFDRIENETHRMRDEVVTYLKKEGNWDSSWDAALQ